MSLKVNELNFTYWICFTISRMKKISKWGSQYCCVTFCQTEIQFGSTFIDCLIWRMSGISICWNCSMLPGISRKQPERSKTTYDRENWRDIKIDTETGTYQWYGTLYSTEHTCCRMLMVWGPRTTISFGSTCLFCASCGRSYKTTP